MRMQALRLSYPDSYQNKYPGLCTLAKPGILLMLYSSTSQDL